MLNHAVSDSTYQAWRGRARQFLTANVAPERTDWRAAQPAPALPMKRPAAQPLVSVPRAFVELAQQAVQHRSDERSALLYRLLWRLTHGERELLDGAADPLVRRVEAMARSVREDIQTMKDCLRFRTIAAPDGRWDIAWYSPEHDILEAVATQLVQQRTELPWSIVTPERSAHWQRGALRFAAGAPFIDDAALDAHWRAHYAGLFDAMPSWSERFVSRPAHAAKPLSDLARDVARCRACPLYEAATQAVMGEGPIDARIMLVGEQPGDQEDLAGRAFVGPAGHVLDRALAEAGISRGQVYVTNAVKHFKFTPRGKRRIHQKPELREITACRSWLDHEIALVKPRLIVALGASAARALLGRSVPVTASRGRMFSLPSSIPVAVTIHPSYVLRLPSQEKSDAEYRRLVADLKAADAHVADTAPVQPMLFAAE
jgi:probable DNA metabolism protein